MELWRDGLIAFLAATGLASIFWLVAGQILRLRLMAPQGAVLVLAVSGYEPQMEKRVRRAQETAWSMKMPPRIVVVDCGMDDATRRAAEELSAWDTTFTLCRADDLKHILEELTNQETKHA